jgi:hypothetical protein
LYYSFWRFFYEKAVAERGTATASTVKKAVLPLNDQAELVRLRKVNGRLRMEHEILMPTRGTRKGHRLLCQGNRMKYGFVWEQQKTYPVTALCAVMQVSTSAFYAWPKTPINTARQDHENQLEARALELFEKTRKPMVHPDCRLLSKMKASKWGTIRRGV